MSSNPYDSPQTSATAGGPPPSAPNPALGIVSLVTGILSFVPGCCCGAFTIPIALIAVGTGAVGIVMANQGKMGGKGMAIAGTILGAVYLVLFGIYLILVATGVVGASIEQMLEEMQNQP